MQYRVPSLKTQQSSPGNHDLFFPMHDADNLFERAERLANRQPGEPHPWVAPKDFHDWLDERIVDTRERLAAAQ